jgi:hypothetical protein
MLDRRLAEYRETHPEGWLRYTMCLLFVVVTYVVNAYV